MPKQKKAREARQHGPRVIAYTRVSTDEQGRSGLGLDAQREAIQNETKRRGWTDVEFVSDGGYSGSSLERPAIQQALRRLAAGEAEVMVVAKLDRLSRSLLDFASMMEKSRTEGWSIVALDLGVDTSTPSGEMLSTVLAAFAVFERRMISQRTSDALQAAKRRGKRLGRPVAINNGIRARIASERDSGRTLQQICDGLNRESIPTAKGGSWTTSTVQRVLQSLVLDAEAAA